MNIPNIQSILWIVLLIIVIVAVLYFVGISGNCSIGDYSFEFGEQGG